MHQKSYIFNIFIKQIKKKYLKNFQLYLLLSFISYLIWVCCIIHINC